MIKKLSRTVFRCIKRRRQMRLLTLESDGLMQNVAIAIQKTILGHSTPEEAEWHSRIESLRSEMSRSEETIRQVDYGAGDSQSDRNKETMVAGLEKESTVAEFSDKVSKPRFWCSLLFNLVREFKPQHCIEMGTALGISASYQAAALRLNGHGCFTTLEGAPAVANFANESFRGLGLQDVSVVTGRFQDTLAGALGKHSSTDYVFIDGHHDCEATLNYFEMICKAVAPKSLLVFDDIAWSGGMKRAWRRIRNDPRVASSIDLGPVGICAITDAAVNRSSYDIPLY